ncbi:MAG: DUF4864 domain-containing protein [Armatimonadota bacterium]
MNRAKGILRAATPIIVLLAVAAGARLLPSLAEKGETIEMQEGRLIAASSAQKSPPSKGKKTAPPAVMPKPVDAKTQGILQKVVSSQLSAFRKDDFARALLYSGPEFRRTYTPAAFKQMVQVGYPRLLNHKGVRFVTAKRAGAMAVMPVFVKSQDGSETSYLYILRRDAAVPLAAKKSKPTKPSADVWFIEGVSQTRGPGDNPAPGSITDIREV